MATDESLWKKVDEMKPKRPKAKQKTTSRQKSARKPSQKPRISPASIPYPDADATGIRHPSPT